MRDARGLGTRIWAGDAASRGPRGHEEAMLEEHAEAHAEGLSISVDTSTFNFVF